MVITQFTSILHRHSPNIKMLIKAVFFGLVRIEDIHCLCELVLQFVIHICAPFSIMFHAMPHDLSILPVTAALRSIPGM